jgi:hypothetical protein
MYIIKTLGNVWQNASIKKEEVWDAPIAGDSPLSFVQLNNHISNIIYKGKNEVIKSIQ